MIILNKSCENKIKNFKLTNKRIGFTNGCFDLLHEGHKYFILECKKKCDYLIVGLNSDKSVASLKGSSRPIETQNIRKKKLENLSVIENVIIFDDLTPEKLINEIKPDVLMKGAEYKQEEIVGTDIVTANGGKVIRIKLLDGISTTNILKERNS